MVYCPVTGKENTLTPLISGNMSLNDGVVRLGKKKRIAEDIETTIRYENITCSYVEGGVNDKFPSSCNAGNSCLTICGKKTLLNFLQFHNSCNLSNIDCQSVVNARMRRKMIMAERKLIHQYVV